MEPIQAPPQEMSYIKLYVTTSSPSKSSAQTRAEDEVTAVNGENIIHSVKVWVFGPENSSSTGTVLYGYVEDSEKHDPTGLEPEPYWKTLSIPVLKGYTEIPNNKVNVYTLANAESVGLGGLTDKVDGAAITEEQLKAQLITVNYFGQASPTTSDKYIAEDGNGLPISRIVTDIPLDNIKSDSQNPLRIVMQRAVSRIRFFVAKQEGVLDTDFQMNSISIKEGLIPTATKVFPETVAYDDVKNLSYKEWPNATTAQLEDIPTYETSALTYTSTVSDIKQVDDPETLLRANHSEMNAQQYSDYLAENATLYNVTYLRETKDQNFTLTINYTMGGENKTIVKDLGDITTKLLRNKEVIVYMYIMGDKELYVNPTVADWIDATKLEYTIDASTNMRLFDSWLYRYDTDGDLTPDNYKNWATSHMLVSSNVDSESDPAGRPMQSPQIQLVTSTTVTGASFELYVDNSDFEIVRANKNEVGVVTSYDHSTGGTLSLVAGEGVYTYFYIMPTSSATAGSSAKVFLYYNDPVLGKQEMTYNYGSLPGYSDDSSEIWVYYVAPDEYKYVEGKVLKMYYQDVNHPLVPTPVQN